MDQKIAWCIIFIVSTCSANKHKCNCNGKPPTCINGKDDLLEYITNEVVNIYCSNKENISEAVDDVCKPMEGEDCHNCTLEIGFKSEGDLKLIINNGTHVFRYETGEKTSRSCKPIEDTTPTTTVSSREAETCTCTSQATIDPTTKTETTTTLDSQATMTTSEKPLADGFHQNVKPSAIQIVGYVALGLVSGIVISAVVFCVLLKRQQNKKDMTKATQDIHKHVESNDTAIRNRNGLNNVLYSELDEPEQIPVSEVHPIRRADESAMKNYEEPLHSNGQQHVYTHITDEYNTVSTKNTQVQEKGSDPENIYNHLHDDEVESFPNPASNDYDHVRGNRQQLNSSFSTDNYDHMPGTEDQINPCSSKKIPIASDGQDANDFYFTSQKQDLTPKDENKAKSDQVDEPISDNYFTLKPQE